MSWYIITTPRHQERMAKVLLDSYPVTSLFGKGSSAELERFNTFLPLRQVAATGIDRMPIENTVPVIPGLLFVQTTHQQLETWMEQTAMACRFYTNVANEPIVVPDYQIRLFKDYLSFVQAEVMVLRKPYSYFLQKKRVRILNGPFAGLEGRLFQIKGNYKLVYGLGNTALALSNIAKYTYVEITEERPEEIRYTFYYDLMQADLEALAKEQATDREVVCRLQHWRQEASVLTLESPLASCYVSLALRQTVADLYDRHHFIFRSPDAFQTIKSMYHDTEDYLSVALPKISNAAKREELQNRCRQMLCRALYHHDPVGILQPEEGATDYAFIRRQEAVLSQVVELLGDAGSRVRVFSLLVSLFKDIAEKMVQPNYQDNLDSTANYRLRKILTLAAHQYRRCKENQPESVVAEMQKTLRSLIRLSTYSPGGFFDLLKAVRSTPADS